MYNLYEPISLFGILLTGPFLLLVNHLFHALWNQLSTIASYRKSSIVQIQIIAPNPERNIIRRIPTKEA
jgi:hypothetical protein